MSDLDKMSTQDIKKQLQAEIQAATFQELVEGITENCYSTCVKKPGTSLDSYEQRCISNCMDRYIDSYNLVTKVFTSHLSSGQH